MSRRRVLTYDETMAQGHREYLDVIEMLAHHGVPSSFMKTGGMKAAVLGELADGRCLLVTGTEDSLAWVRETQAGQGVSLFESDQLEDNLASGETDETSLRALLELALLVNADANV